MAAHHGGDPIPAVASWMIDRIKLVSKGLTLYATGGDGRGLYQSDSQDAMGRQRGAYIHRCIERCDGAPS
jgi:hypothetical protein